MKYSYITDEKLRSSLQRKREEVSKKNTVKVDGKSLKQPVDSKKISSPKKVRTNRKFESLKAKKKLGKKI